MAWEWVGVVSTGTVGIVGYFANLRVANQGRLHAEELAKLRNDHERQIAREERTKRNRSDAYVDLLEMVEEFGEWTAGIRDGSMGNSGHSQIDKIYDSGFARVRALVSAYGSQEVKNLTSNWLAAVKKFSELNSEISRVIERASSGEEFPSSYATLSGELDTVAKAAECEARERLATQVAAELQ